MSMFNDISCNSFLCMQRDLEKDKWSFIGLGFFKWYSISQDCPQGIWDNKAERMLLEFAESDCSIFRATTPLSRGRLRSKGHGKLSIHFAADQKTIETIFRIIVSANQLSLYGAIAEMCQEYETLHERTERPVVMGQSSSSLVRSVIKTEVSLDSDDPAYQNFLLQQYEERIEKLSQQDGLSKFCLDAGFREQFYTVACRECTFPKEEEASQPKGWIQGNTKIGPVLAVATSYLHGKHGVDVRIWSLNRDNTHSWVRISHGSNKFVMNLNNNETEIPEVQLEEYALKLDAKDLACRSKAKAKPHRRELAGSSPRTVPFEKRTWTDVEPGKYSLSNFEVSKKVSIFFVIHNKCIEKKMERFLSGELKKIFRNISCIALIGLMASGRKGWQEEEETRKDTSTVLIFRNNCLSFRTQSFWSFITGQCCYSDQPLLVHLSCRMCNQFTFHHQVGINSWMSKFEQETDIILPAC